MKKILTFFFFISITLSSIAQVKIKKSNDIIVILGRKYYVHPVKKGETLYSICRTYNVPRDQVILINKEEVKNLQAGSILRIPVIDSNYKPSPIQKISFQQYKVHKHESLYSIAKKFGISQDDIIKYNPQIQNGLKKHMVLKIPMSQKENIEAQDDFFYYHQVRPGETLKLIALEYNTDPEEIKKFNDNITVLQVGSTIAIPKKHFSEEETNILKYNQPVNPNFISVDPNYFETPNYPPCYKFQYNDSMVFNISILLPLFIDQNYQLSLDALTSPKSAHFFSNTMFFYNFLEGSLLAIKKLKNEGLNLNIHIYDTKGDSATLASIFTEPDFNNSDLVIGPVYSYLYKYIKNYANEKKINFISPLSRKIKVIKNNPFIYQVLPSYVTITKFTAKFIKQYADTSVISVVTNGSKEQEQLYDTLKYQLTKYSDNADSLHIKNIPFSKFIDIYKDSLNPTKLNIVYITSTNEIQVSAILNNLNALVKVYNYRIIVYAEPVIQNFTKLQSEWLSNLNLHYAATNTSNQEEWEIQEFNQRFKKIFGKFPDNFAYIGYDATYYFISALRTYGRYFQFCLNDNEEINNSGIFIKFKFDRYDEHSGFENTKLNMFYYTKDLRLEKADEVPSEINSFFQ
jgi:LysM repeat protein